MARQRNAFKLGLTVLVMAALLFAILMFLADFQSFFARTRQIRIEFTESEVIEGLKPDSPVLMGRVPVGHVTDVTLEWREGKDNPGVKALYTVATAEIPRDYPLYTDCEVLLEAPPLGGNARIVVKTIGDNGMLVQGGDRIDGTAPAGFGAVLAQLSDLGTMLQQELNPRDPDSLIGALNVKVHRSLDDLNAVTASVRTQLDPGEKTAILSKLHGIMDHINAVTAELKHQADPDSGQMLTKLNGALDQLNAGLGEAVAMLTENRGPIKGTVGHLQGVARTLDEKIAANVAQQTDPNTPGSLMAKIHTAIDQVNQALGDITAVTDTTRGVLTVNRTNIEDMIGNLKETSDHLKAAAKDLRRNPWRLFYRPDEKETEQLNTFDAARAFAEAATELDDATGKLQALAAAHDQAIPADDPQLQRIREQLKRSFEKFAQAEAALWKQLDVQ